MNILAPASEKSGLRLRLRRQRRGLEGEDYIRGLEDIGDLSDLFKLRDSEGDSSTVLGCKKNEKKEVTRLSFFRYPCKSLCAAGENFENFQRPRSRFLPSSAPQAKIFRIIGIQ